ncbi:MAG: S66 family peptidase [Francisellaceae bacterium]
MKPLALPQAIRFPKALEKGDRIAVTAPSSGVEQKWHRRLDYVLQYWRDLGFEIIEGVCLRGNHKHVSASAKDRAAELMHFLTDSDISAIIPPWGGELAIDLLERLDFGAIACLPPKWIVGYSDTSTLLVAMTSMTGWATLHGANMMDSDALEGEMNEKNYRMLTTKEQWVTQYSSAWYANNWCNWSDNPSERLTLNQKTEIKSINWCIGQAISGRMIGGCLDTLMPIADTCFFDSVAFRANFAEKEGIILYLENCELSPCALVRALYGLKYRGFFDHIDGLLLGRSAADVIRDESKMNYDEAVVYVLSALKIPVLYDVDIGHKPPQMSIVNGARSIVEFDGSVMKLKQQFD